MGWEEGGEGGEEEGLDVGVAVVDEGVDLGLGLFSDWKRLFLAGVVHGW